MSATELPPCDVHLLVAMTRACEAATLVDPLPLPVGGTPSEMLAAIRVVLQTVVGHLFEAGMACDFALADRAGGPDQGVEDWDAFAEARASVRRLPLRCIRHEAHEARDATRRAVAEGSVPAIRAARVALHRVLWMTSFGLTVVSAAPAGPTCHPRRHRRARRRGHST